MPVLQFALEQHEYILPAPFTTVLAGHSVNAAHEYAVLVNTPLVYVEAVFNIKYDENIYEQKKIKITIKFFLLDNLWRIQELEPYYCLYRHYMKL